MCTDQGGTLDDLIVYRLEANRFMLCVNAANIEPDREWLLRQNSPGAELIDLSEEMGLIAIQGPAAAEILSRVSQFPPDAIRRYHAQSGKVAKYSCLVARTGYTGEDGFELFVASQDAAALFDALLNSGSVNGLKPCGLGARDTLRMEAGLALYGHELDRTISPLEAGLAPFVKFGHGFIGEAALTAQRDQGPKRQLAGIQTDDKKRIARQGYKLIRDGVEVGVVTSGTFAPTFNRPLAMGLVDTSAKLKPGDRLGIEIRQRTAPATIVPLPFYRRKSV
jgi:aminomethyltransferase